MYVILVYQTVDSEITRPPGRDRWGRKGNPTDNDDITLSDMLLQGGLSANEFYKKNNRWSEGLISAAKAVGWGANILV